MTNTTKLELATLTLSQLADRQMDLIYHSLALRFGYSPRAGELSAPETAELLELVSSELSFRGFPVAAVK